MLSSSMEHLDRRSLLGVAGLVGVAALASRSGAGQLDPPAGPVAPTGKTTAELFDRTAQAERFTQPSTPVGADTTPGDATALRIITEPGHYHLTANLIVPDPYTIAILATAPGVTINLNGFAIIAGHPGAQTAVRIEGIGGSVSNGYISGFSGLSVDFSNADSARVDRLAFSNCPTGVWTSDFATISRCTFHECANLALHTETGAIVTECTFKLCTASVELNQGIMERCTILSAARSLAVSAANGSIIRYCTINATVNDGLGPDETPIRLSSDTRMEHCVVTANTRQAVILATGSCVIGHCTVRNYSNNTAITQQISIDDGCTMHECTIRRTNSGGGITAQLGSACVFKGNMIIGPGLATSTVSGTPRSAVYANTAFTGGSASFVFDTGLIQSPVHVAPNALNMPPDFSAFGNIVG